MILNYICNVVSFKQFIKVFFTVLGHISVWVIYFALPHLLYDLPLNHFNYKYRLLEIGLAVFFFYICYYVFVPKLIMKKRFVQFGVVVIASLIATNILATHTAPYFPAQEKVVMRMEHQMPYGGSITMERSIQKAQEVSPYKPNRPRTLTFSILLIMAVSSSASLAMHYYKQEKLRKESEREKLTGELQFLKSQINPHFLFNVLNNMYGLALKKSDLLPDVVLKLSGMMRYMLYESEDKQVPLQNEITYLEHYIDLQKLRLAGSIDISFLKEGILDGKLISPMLLIPFAENIFKHGITHDGSSYIFIYLKVDGDTLVFKTDNPFTGHKAKDKASGIGIQNVRRRLELLYPRRHSIETKIEDNRYIATIILQLHGQESITR